MVDELSLHVFDRSFQAQPLLSGGTDSDGFARNTVNRSKYERRKSQHEYRAKGSRWHNIHFIGDSLRYVLGSFEGPPNSPYEGGIFHLLLRPVNDYPLWAPGCRMLTKIYHPNVSPKGEVCHDLLKGSCGPMYDLANTVISISSLLEDPGLEDPLVPEIAETYVTNRSIYDENARVYTERYARKISPTLETIERFVWICEKLAKESL